MNLISELSESQQKAHCVPAGSCEESNAQNPEHVDPNGRRKSGTTG
jgi:hypothetical protein